MGDVTPKRTGARGEALPLDNPTLPTSSVPRGYCPRCNRQSSFEVSRPLWVTSREDPTRGAHGTAYEALDQVVVAQCRDCEQGTVVVEEKWFGHQPARDVDPEFRRKTLRLSDSLETWHAVHYWPLPAALVADDVPAQIAAAFAEATTALHAGCARAGAAMLRRALEAVAEDKGETKGSLKERLERLASAGVLQPSLAAWAHEVRLLGNDAVHDMLAPVAIEDAWQLHTYMRQLMAYLYEMPAQLQRLRAKGTQPVANT